MQDYPGRVGLWHVGVPPSGAMDPPSLRFANALVGNPPSAAALEVTLTGPTLRFHRAATVAVCGAALPVSIDGAPAARWTAVSVPAGSVLKIGTSEGGSRCYLAVAGGFDAPVYLGSRSTFPAGNLGGYQGRPLQVACCLLRRVVPRAYACPLALYECKWSVFTICWTGWPSVRKKALRPWQTAQVGDVCELGAAPVHSQPPASLEVPLEWRPECDPPDGGASHAWTVRMLPGPQAAPDYLTQEAMDVRCSALVPTLLATAHASSTRSPVGAHADVHECGV